MKGKGLIVILIVVLIAAVIWAGGTGALYISPAEIAGMVLKALGWDTGITYSGTQENVFWIIRLPRVLLALIVGATLSAAGAAMQGLFRNPLADPGLIGISSGASTAAVGMIVLGSLLNAEMQRLVGNYGINLAAFLGALLATVIVYRIGQQNGKTNVGIMLLAGIAINALAGAATGFIILTADDQQLRSLTFWTMGSLGGATWKVILSVLPFCLICILGLPLMAKQLNAFSLGERDAAYLGVRVERLKHLVMLFCALGVGAAVSVSGIIGFVGLVVPHIVRMINGPEHRALLIASSLMGASLLILADLFSRTVAAPTEIPIGVITALTGGPFFLYLLIREKRKSIVV